MPAMSNRAAFVRPPLDAITDVPGIKVGHWTDRRRATGCTVVRINGGATAGYTNPGGAPGTIDTDLLRPENSISSVHAVILTGGSAYGLEAASGVRHQLRDDGIGFRFGPDTPIIPIVSGAVIYDLGLGSSRAYPGVDQGRRATRNAKGGRVEQGSVGAGTGCTVAKLAGTEFLLKAGIGTASIQHESTLVVGALVAVNAVGDVFDPGTGALIAGPRGKRRGQMRRGADLLLQRSLADYFAEGERMQAGVSAETAELENTTIGVVATNAKLNKAQVGRLAIMATDGLSTAIRPAHTPADGDTIFALATAQFDLEIEAHPGLLTLLGAMAAQAVGQAIVNGVQAARGLGDVPSPSEWRRPR